MPWIPLLPLLAQLRECFPREITFHFFCLGLAGFMICTDKAGVLGLMRALSLSPRAYHGLLRAFHTKAVSLEKLVEVWTSLVLLAFKPFLTTIEGRLVIVADGLKVPKEGRKMPAVKVLHQESNNNSKPPWIMGHIFQSAGILVTGLRRIFAVPGFSRVHEGLQASNRENRTLVDKLLVALLVLPVEQAAYVVVDSYYAAWTFARLLVANNHHLISQVRGNAVARQPAQEPVGKPRRGRKPKYGETAKLSDLFGTRKMTTAEMNVYGNDKFTVSYWTGDSSGLRSA